MRERSGTSGATIRYARDSNLCQPTPRARGAPVSIQCGKVEGAMVQLAKREPTKVYVVLEGDRAIGRVVAPAGEPVLAPGAGTVLLRREPATDAAA